VPSVVTNEGTFSRHTIIPLPSPITAQIARLIRIAGIGAMPKSSAAKCMRNGASANTIPTDRSISPRTSSSTMPTDTIAAGAVAWAMLTRLE
jgi:hypothetical protein